MSTGGGRIGPPESGRAPRAGGNPAQRCSRRPAGVVRWLPTGPAGDYGGVPTITELVPAGHADLLRLPATATLTTLDRSGRPASTAVWYLLDTDGELKSSVTTDRQKYRNLRADPRCSLLVIDPANSFRTQIGRAHV